MFYTSPPGPLSSISRDSCHCERSEAISLPFRLHKDCFVAHAPRNDMGDTLRPPPERGEELLSAHCSIILQASVMGKKIGSSSDLLVINILALLLIVIIALFPSNILRIILGLPFLLFFPGYALMAALFHKKVGLGGMERVALGFGLSIAVTALIGLILNYTPWGISLYPILLALTCFILVTSAIAYYRRRRVSIEERFTVSFQIALPRLGGLSNLDKALSIVLVLSILGAIGALGYVVAAPRAGEQFTEFFVLGLEGEVEDYPREFVVGEEGKVTLGIVNHEGQETSYYIEVTIDGVKNTEIGPLVLADEGKWEQEVSFVPQVAGDDQKVEFLLYKNGESEPYQTLHLFIDVRERS